MIKWCKKMWSKMFGPKCLTAQERAVERITDRVDRRFETANREIDALIESLKHQREQHYDS